MKIRDIITEMTAGATGSSSVAVSMGEHGGMTQKDIIKRQKSYTNVMKTPGVVRGAKKK